jgi:hypothetical protein
MKKFIVIPMIALLAIPAFAGTTKTTTTRTYDSTTTAPLMDSERDAEMIEAEEESYTDSLDQDAIEQERMEERMVEEQKMEEPTTDEDIIDYSDRTRTNRERKALNTGSHASDDH